MSKIPFWEGYIPPGKIFGNLYFVGTRPASTHLIDTGDGLILIDPGFPEAVEQILENIRSIGFNPLDIRKILLSHGHYDHAGATKAFIALTGATVYLGKKDLKMVTGAENSSLAEEEFGVAFTDFFTPDVLLNDEDHVTLGNTDVLCLSTPGHTAGTMSFFFNVTDGTTTYCAGMHGGVGTNTLTKAFLTEHGLPFTNRDVFLNSLEKVKGEPVEIFLGNHVGNNDTEGKLQRVHNGEKLAFLAPNEWLTFLESRKERLNNLISKENMGTMIESILNEKIIMIIRGISAEKLCDVADAMYHGGIRLMECTYDASGKVSDEETAKSIELLAKRFEGKMLIGAGTVLKKEQVWLTKAAGGKFIISPDTNEEIIAETKKAGLISIPGALTPTEITTAHRAGADFIKLFPISSMGANYVKAICAPLSHIRLLAVGGINENNIHDYLHCGVCGFGMGLNAQDKEHIANNNFLGLHNNQTD